MQKLLEVATGTILLLKNPEDAGRTEPLVRIRPKINSLRLTSLKSPNRTDIVVVVLDAVVLIATVEILNPHAKTKVLRRRPKPT